MKEVTESKFKKLKKTFSQNAFNKTDIHYVFTDN